MNLSSITHSSTRKTAVRIGRGGKRGKTSGRGTKGQKAHGSHGIRAHVRDIIRKLPKLRGRGMNLNGPVGPKPVSVSIAQLAATTTAGMVVDMSVLVQSGLVQKSHQRRGAKILSTGEITHAITVRGIVCSAGAATKIQSAGGTVEA